MQTRRCCYDEEVGFGHGITWQINFLLNSYQLYWDISPYYFMPWIYAFGILCLASNLPNCFFFVLHSMHYCKTTKLLKQPTSSFGFATTYMPFLRIFLFQSCPLRLVQGLVAHILLALTAKTFVIWISRKNFTQSCWTAFVVRDFLWTHKQMISTL